MGVILIEKNGVKYISGVRGERLIEKESHIPELLGSCYEYDTNRLLLYKENLPPEFVKLASGQAGMVLNKLMTYKVKFAAVVDRADLERGKFAEMVTEVNMYNSLFHVFADHKDAEEWIVKD